MSVHPLWTGPFQCAPNLDRRLESRRGSISVEKLPRWLPRRERQRDTIRGDASRVTHQYATPLPPHSFLRLLLSLYASRRELEAGDHLIGVYGDNWLRAASFSLMAIPLKAAAKEEIASVNSVDEQLVAQRELLKEFKVSAAFVEAVRGGLRRLPRVGNCTTERKDAWYYETEHNTH